MKISIQAKDGQSVNCSAYVEMIIQKALEDLIFFLATKLKDEEIQSISARIRPLIIQQFGYRFTISALLHCFDLVKSCSYPFDQKERFGFAADHIPAYLNQYLDEQRKRVREYQKKQDTALDFTQIENSEMPQAIKELGMKLSADSDNWWKKKHTGIMKMTNFFNPKIFGENDRQERSENQENK